MILRGSVFSRVLEMDTGITVVTPRERSDNSICRVAYLLHGLCGNNGNWVDHTLLTVYAKNLDVVFVMPEVARSFYTDMKFGLKYFTYVSEELPTICERTFNISSNRVDTSIIGGSMGGYGALKCALTRPDRFSQCCALSSACLFMRKQLADLYAAGNLDVIRAMVGEQLVTDFQAAFGEKVETGPGDELLDLAAAIRDPHLKPALYLACGGGDDLLESNKKFAQAMTDLRFDVTFDELPGGHDWPFFNAALEEALRYCYPMDYEEDD